MIPILHEIDLNDCIGKEIVFKALVIGSKASKTKSDKQYLDVDIQSKNITKTRCKMWNTGNLDLAKPGGVYMVTATIETYMNDTTVSISSLDEIPEEDPKDYVHRAENIDYVIKYIDDLLEKMPDNSIIKVTKDIYSRYREKFSYYPAAKTHHHNLIGGLAWHSYNLIKLGGMMCKLYPNLKIDLIVSIALLHDMGKTREYSVDNIGVIGFTKEGSLLGHITIMLNEIELTIAKLGLDSMEDGLLALKNGVASHHGKLEWGSPVIPYTPEAKLIHYVDMIDSEMYKTNIKLVDMEDGKIDTYFNFGEMVGVFKY